VPRFEKRILARFPKAEELAFERIFSARKNTFFDAHSRTPTNPGYSEELILAGLWLANRWAQKAGFELDLSAEEKRLLKKTFRLKRLRDE
jgi:hypothetical protein